MAAVPGVVGGVIPQVGVGVLSDPARTGLVVAERAMSVTVVLEMLPGPPRNPDSGWRCC